MEGRRPAKRISDLGIWWLGGTAIRLCTSVGSEFETRKASRFTLGTGGFSVGDVKLKQPVLERRLFRPGLNFARHFGPFCVDHRRACRRAGGVARFDVAHGISDEVHLAFPAAEIERTIAVCGFERRVLRDFSAAHDIFGHGVLLLRVALIPITRKHGTRSAGEPNICRLFLFLISFRRLDNDVRSSHRHSCPRPDWSGRGLFCPDGGTA